MAAVVAGGAAAVLPELEPDLDEEPQAPATSATSARPTMTVPRRPVPRMRHIPVSGG